MILFLRRSRNLIGMVGERERIEGNDFHGRKDRFKRTAIIMIGCKSVTAVTVLLALNIDGANQVQSNILKSGAKNWNSWREKKYKCQA